MWAVMSISSSYPLSHTAIRPLHGPHGEPVDGPKGHFEVSQRGSAAPAIDQSGAVFSVSEQ